MGFFKNDIKVIKVRTVKREIVEETSERSVGYYSSESKKTIKNNEITQVLLMKNGELYVKEFNGKWDLDDVKVMEG